MVLFASRESLWVPTVYFAWLFGHSRATFLLTGLILIFLFYFFASSSRFTNLTETGEATAQNCLSQYAWKLDLAVDQYFSQPSRFLVAEPKTQPDRRKVEQLFQKYKESDRERNNDYILVNGMIRLLEDLRLKPDSIRILILAWKCEAKTQCEFR